MKDNNYSFIEKDETYKKNGQYFTPSDITDFILDIHNDLSFKSVYDPTSGYCSTLKRVYSKYKKDCDFYGVEYDKKIYEESLSRVGDIENFNIINGDTLTDQFKDNKFDLIIANPPFGIKYKKEDYENNYKYLPKTSDSFILFFQHIINKLNDNGTAYVVSNGSPLFSGDACSSESNFRKYLFNNNLIEEIYQLPEGLFYDTSITTYIWKIKKRNNNKIKLINAVNCFNSVKKNVNKKNKELDYNKLKDSEIKELDKDFFFYNKVKIKFTEKNEDGKFETDNEIIEYSSNVSKNEELTQSFLDKWVEREYIPLENKVGVEINFNKIFYKPEVLRPIDDIKTDLEASNAALVGLMGDIFND